MLLQEFRSSAVQLLGWVLKSLSKRKDQLPYTHLTMSATISCGSVANMTANILSKLYYIKKKMKKNDFNFDRT